MCAKLCKFNRYKSSIHITWVGGTSRSSLATATPATTFNQCFAASRIFSPIDSTTKMSCFSWTSMDVRRDSSMTRMLWSICLLALLCTRVCLASTGMFYSTAKKLNQTIVQAYPEIEALKGSSVAIPCNVSHWAAANAISVPLSSLHSSASLPWGLETQDSSLKLAASHESNVLEPKAELYLSAESDGQRDTPKLILWYHGQDISGSPIYTLDGRDLLSSNSKSEATNRTMQHFVSSQYQDRARVDLSAQSVQLWLDSVDINDTGTYWCRVDFRWTRTLISMVQLKVHVKPSAVNVWARGSEQSEELNGHSLFYLTSPLYRLLVNLTSLRQSQAIQTVSFSNASPGAAEKIESKSAVRLSKIDSIVRSVLGHPIKSNHESMLSQLINSPLSLRETPKWKTSSSSSSLWASQYRTKQSKLTTHTTSIYVIQANEGANLQLNCEVLGGIPGPSIVWLDSEQTVIDRTYHTTDWQDSPYVLDYILYEWLTSNANSLQDAQNHDALTQLLDNYNLNGSRTFLDDDQFDAHLEQLDQWIQQHWTTSARAKRMVVSTNGLEMFNLHRSLSGHNFTCLVNNTRLAHSSRTTFHLDLNLNPLRVTILPPSGSYLSDSLKTEITCRACGARPYSLITWSLQGTNFTQFSDFDIDSNCTESRLRLLPKWTQDGHELVCVAYNPFIVNLTHHSHLHETLPHPLANHSLVLDIKYVPQIKLLVRNELPSSKLPTMKSNVFEQISVESDPIYAHVEEGGSLTLECVLIAKPSVTVIRWLFNQAQIWTRTDGLQVNNQSLTIVNANRSQHEGNYRCIAFNAEGKGVSNEVRIIVDYAPHCIDQLPSESSVQVHLGSRTKLSCQLDARPSHNLTFYWTLNNQIDSKLEPIGLNQTIDMAPTGPVVGHAYFTPRQLEDFGIVRCWARNKVGYQARPCVIRVKHMQALEAIDNNSSYGNQIEPKSSYEPESGGPRREDVLNKELHLLSHQCLLNQTVSTIGLNCSVLPDSQLENLIMSRVLRVGQPQTKAEISSIVSYQILLHEFASKSDRILLADRLVLPTLDEKEDDEEVNEMKQWRKLNFQLANLTSNTAYQLTMKTWLATSQSETEDDEDNAWQTKSISYNLIGNKLIESTDVDSLDSINPTSKPYEHKLYSIEFILLTTLSDTYVGFHNQVAGRSGGAASQDNLRDKIEPKSLKDNSLLRPMLLFFSFTWLLVVLLIFVALGFVCLKLKRRFLTKGSETHETPEIEANKLNDINISQIVNKRKSDANDDKLESDVTCFMNSPAFTATTTTTMDPFRLCLLSNVATNPGGGALYPGIGGGSSGTESYTSSLATNSTLVENGTGSVASFSNASPNPGARSDANVDFDFNRLVNTFHLIDSTTGQTLNLYGSGELASGLVNTSANATTSFEQSNPATSGLHVTLCDTLLATSPLDGLTLTASPLIFPSFSSSDDQQSQQSSTLFIANPAPTSSNSLVTTNNYMTLTEEVILEDGLKQAFPTSYPTCD